MTPLDPHSDAAWQGDDPAAVVSADAVSAAIRDVDRALLVKAVAGGYELRAPDRSPLGSDGTAHVPAQALERLGDASFRADHGLRYAYVTGSMAGGIASCDIVEAMAGADMLGFFGAAGKSLREIEDAIDRLERTIPGKPQGFNLIHTPSEIAVEQSVVDLYLRRGVRCVEASAYLGLTPQLVQYRVSGLHRSPNGEIVAPNRIVAKASRVEVATKFFSPPPLKILNDLVDSRKITAAEAELAAEIPMAQDLTAEADSGGHTDNRPALALLPTFLALRDRQQELHGFSQLLRVGLAGGIATPHSTMAAFAMGAAYVMTGSINQACVESGTSDAVREMLAGAEQADITMAPAPDMFEMGVKVQVLKRGTMFAMRGAKLHDLYRECDSLESLPAAERAKIEKTLFRANLDEVWVQTREYFLERDPSQVERAEGDPKHKMALVFRWYLGLSSRWATQGEPTRRMDYQIWCGPAMAAFNEWTRGSFLEQAENRRVVTLACNLLHGAAVLGRFASLRSQGIELPTASCQVSPVDLPQHQQRPSGARANA